MQWFPVGARISWGEVDTINGKVLGYLAFTIACRIGAVTPVSCHLNGRIGLVGGPSPLLGGHHLRRWGAYGLASKLKAARYVA